MAAGHKTKWSLDVQISDFSISVFEFCFLLS